MQNKLEDLHGQLTNLRRDIDHKQNSHVRAVLDKQEMLHVTVNASQADTHPQRVSSDLRTDIVAQRSAMYEAKSDLDVVHNKMRDWQRNIPTLAADFEFDVEQVSAHISVLQEQNSDIKADIVCLEEEKKTAQLFSTLEDAKIEDSEYELKLLQKK